MNKSSNNANIKKRRAKAPIELKKIYREELVGCSLKGMGRLKSVSDYACEQIYGRGVSLDDLKNAMANGEKTVDVKHGGFIYNFNGTEVCVTNSGLLKTVISKDTGVFNNSLLR